MRRLVALLSFAVLAGPLPALPGSPLVGQAAAASVPTTTSIILTLNYGVVGSPMDFHVQVNPAPSGGTVHLKIDDVVVASQSMQAGNPDVLVRWTPSTPGAYTAVAGFGGTTGFDASNSDAFAITILRVTPYVLVTPSTHEPALDQIVDFTATLSPDPGAGTVEWLVNDVVEETMALEAGGVAHWSRSFAQPFDHSVKAHFTGNDTYLESTGNANIHILPVPTTVTVTLPSDPLPAGPVTATVTISPNPGGGTLTWRLSSTGPATVPVDDDGVTDVALGSLGSQSAVLTVLFDGYDRYASSEGTASFTVLPEGGVTLSTNRTTATQGELPVVLTAAVAPFPGGTSTVTFLDDVGGDVIELGALPVDSITLRAVYTSSALRIGSHTVRARFDGVDGSVLPFVSDPISLTVLPDTVVHGTFKPSATKFYPVKDGYRDTVSLGGALDESATVTIRVYDKSGHRKRTWSLGTRSAGTYSVAWNGRSSSGTLLGAGKYTVKVSLKDARGHTRTIPASITISRRQVAWKTGTAITRYGDQLTYFASPGDHLFYSDDYSRGRILYSAEFDRDCDPNCQIVYGQATLSLKKSALDIRRVKVTVVGHTFVDYGSGSAMAVRWSTGEFGFLGGLPEYKTQPATYSLTKRYVSSSHKVRFVVWCTQSSGDAFDLHRFKLTYQYAVWK